MKSLDFSRYALSSCVAVAMLAGCGESQPPIGAPGAMPRGRRGTLADGPRAIALVSIVLLSVWFPSSSSANETASTSNVTVTAILCDANLEGYSRKRVAPTVLLDSGEQKHLKTTLSGFFLTISFEADQGFHRLALIAPYGATAMEFDKIRDHPRSLIVSMCSSLTHYDIAPAVTVVLPIGGLSPYILVHSNRDESVFEQMTIDDGVAYATSVAPGGITLVVPYSSGSERCEYLLSDAKSAEQNPHLRFRLTFGSMTMGKVPGVCGTLVPFY